jgi:hypothetical protein
MGVVSFAPTPGVLALDAGPGSASRKAVSEEREVVRSPTEKTFYGWQILATGGLGGVLVASAIALPNRPIGGLLPTVGFIVGLPVYVFGGPVVHWTHGDFSKGLWSFGANIAIPLAAGIAVMSATPDDHTLGFARGAAVGALTVPVLDALVFGWEDVPADVATKRTGGSMTMTLSPAIEMRARGGVICGVRGRF